MFYLKEMFKSMIRKKLNRNKPPALLEHRFDYVARVLLFPRHQFLFEIFDRKLQQYIEADLINYNTRGWNDEINPKRAEEQKKPYAILTLEELEAGFVVCLVPFFLSMLVFFFECFPTFKDWFIFLYIFKAYFKMRASEQKAQNGANQLKLIRKLAQR